ncbi:MAG TPA: methyltransferase domain-containing protein [Candidatus Binataceae bacterium]|nr:methyltransferase domain-containing protein [Candidatus Binataceae bacterium]
MTTRRRSEHGFTSVDQQSDPSAWVACLDKLHREPFYAAYKQRVAVLMEPHAGELLLDVGGGAGDDARALAMHHRCRTMALDRSFTMMRECHARGGVIAIVGDASALPFRDNSFDGCRADRTFQHLLEPHRALREMVRVTRPSGRVVVVDPDYDTQVMEFPDQELERRVLRFRADHGLRHGTLAHRMPAMFRDAGLDSISVEPMTLLVRDPAAVDNVMGLRTWARSAHRAGLLDASDVTRWEDLYDTTVRAGSFLYAVTFFITSGLKPG